MCFDFGKFPDRLSLTLMKFFLESKDQNEEPPVKRALVFLGPADRLGSAGAFQASRINDETFN